MDYTYRQGLGLAGFPGRGAKKYSDEEVAAFFEEFTKLKEADHSYTLKQFCTEREIGYTTIQQRFTRLEHEALAAGFHREPVAERTAKAQTSDTVQAEIAKEATIQTQQYIVLGKVVWNAFSSWASRRGMTLDEIKSAEIHKVIVAALEKESDYDNMARKVQELENQVSFLSKEVNPIVKLKQATQFIIDFGKMAQQNEAMEELFGFSLNLEPAARVYNKLLNDYMKRT